jgi:hypothetical protein
MAESNPEDSHFSPCCGHAAGSHFATGGGQMGRFHMMVKASAASTLLLAAGLFFGLAGPLPAEAAGQDDTAANSKTDSATSGKSAKQSSHNLKKRDAHRKSERATSKSDEAKREKDAAETSNGTESAVPDAVANARAQMVTANAAPDSARAMSEAMSAKASTALLASADKPAEAQAAADDATVVASDQLNDVDRALQQEGASTQTVAMASAKPAEEAPAASATNDSSTLDKTSLVGKIFIAFGALLTMASAARMFMA